MKNPKKLSTESYKGVRDFYPEDMAVQNHIFNIWKKAVEKYGYEEYSASVLEPADLYRAKSGEEIVNEQTYTFTDRGDREVTLRPEMTPTVARMVAGKRRELSFPLRWYSIPNLFRYEQPQRGRLREHFQLNVDIFGVESTEAEVEIIQIASDITKAYGLAESDFEIRISNRKIINYITTDLFKLDEDKAYKLSKLIDRKRKLSAEVFEMGVKELVLDKAEMLITLLNSGNFEEFTSKLQLTSAENEGIAEVKKVIARLNELGVNNVRFDQTLMRGFDYYTGIVFEVFDLNPENKRSVFGGGRYDNLTALFGNDAVTGVGFGAGDVIARDIMESKGTLRSNSDSAGIELYIVSTNEDCLSYATELAEISRDLGIRTAVDLTDRKIGDKIKYADKKKIPFITVIGEDEIKSGKITLKRMRDGDEKNISPDEIYSSIREINA